MRGAIGDTPETTSKRCGSCCNRTQLMTNFIATGVTHSVGELPSSPVRPHWAELA
jgi:hypothetical protein